MNGNTITVYRMKTRDIVPYIYISTGRSWQRVHGRSAYYENLDLTGFPIFSTRVPRVSMPLSRIARTALVLKAAWMMERWRRRRILATAALRGRSRTEATMDGARRRGCWRAIVVTRHVSPFGARRCSGRWR